MASDVEIANRAMDKLGALGLSPITNLSTDRTKEAKLINRMYHFLRKKELSANYWKFAKKRVTLAHDIDTPDDYAYQYELPSDFLRIYKVGTNYPYELEGRKILTDDGPSLSIQYIADITDPNLFDPIYSEAFAALIAQECCEALNQSNSKRELAILDYRENIKLAKLMDAIQEPPIDMEDGSWIESRY